MDDTVVETIETLTDRLQTSILLDDRRDACRGLRSLAKDYREICARAMDPLLQAIKNDRHDTEMVNYCLEALNYIISGKSLGDSPAALWQWSDSDPEQTQQQQLATSNANNDHGRELAEIFLKKPDNVTTILDTIIDNDLRTRYGDFKTRWVAVRLLCGLTRENLLMVQKSILSFPLNLSRLTQLVERDEHELVRNDAIVLFVRLTKSDQDIQNIVAYENFFDKIFEIIEIEGYLEGTVAVVMDCLNILLNLIQTNEPNQILFRESIHRLMPFFNNIQTIQWTNEKTDCLVLVLRIIDSMIVPANTQDHVEACQRIMQSCGLLDRLCELLTATSMPLGVLSETMNTASDIIRGQLGPNSNVVMQTSAIMPVLLLSLVKDMCQRQEKRIDDMCQDQEKRIDDLHKYLLSLHEYLCKIVIH